MARSRSRSQRDTIDSIPSDLSSLLRPSRPASVAAVSSFRAPPRRFEWSQVEDLRSFDFNPPAARARSMDGIASQIVHGTAATVPARPSKQSSVAVVPGRASPSRVAPVFFPSERFRFAVPEAVMICARRKERREVLFAKRRFGRGGKRRRTPYSDVSCR